MNHRQVTHPLLPNRHPQADVPSALLVPWLAGCSWAVLIPPKAPQVLWSGGSWVVSLVGSAGPWDSGAARGSTQCKYLPLHVTILASCSACVASGLPGSDLKVPGDAPRVRKS